MVISPDHYSRAAGTFSLYSPVSWVGITVAKPSGNVINFGYATDILVDTITQPGVPGAIFVFLLLNLVFIGLVSLTISTVDFDVIGKNRSFSGSCGSDGTIRQNHQALWHDGEFRSTAAKAVGCHHGGHRCHPATIFRVLTAALIGSSALRE
ncbi:hypothetical protein DSL92_06205 [Billgrantia gudaonensis]|uniref:Uncharacterized protein n=1 Tax=Billgrantia gudaonensis TaxID=376427 RepID=A0A432JIY9_9GAMM|nr:hypothetical protein DSL92_06205 [Halomonas gudaonensis]